MPCRWYMHFANPRRDCGGASPEEDADAAAPALAAFAAAFVDASVTVVQIPLAANVVRHRSNGYVVNVAANPAVAPATNATDVLEDAIPLMACRIGPGNENDASPIPPPLLCFCPGVPIAARFGATGIDGGGEGTVAKLEMKSDVREYNENCTAAYVIQR